jgi:hypothetical protein
MMISKKIYVAILWLICSFGAVSVQADAIILDIGAKSNHLIKGDFNEEHNWYGIGYRFVEKDDYSIQVKGAQFINSYNDNTKFLALTGIYTPIQIYKVKIGISGSIGYQDGYYVNKEGTVHSSNAKRLGIGDKSILVLYSLYGELDNLLFNYTYIPGSVEAITFGMKVIEW